MGYWRSVLKEAFWKSAKAVRVETRQAVVILFAGQAIIAIILWNVQGDAALPTRIATAAMPFILFLILFGYNALAVPAERDVKLKTEIDRLSGELSAKDTAPKPVQLSKVKALMTLCVEKCRRMRSKHTASIAFQRAWGDELLQDIEALFGAVERGKAQTRFRNLWRGDARNADGIMSTWANDIEEKLKTLSQDDLWPDTANLAEYVEDRLNALNAQAPTFGVSSPLDR